jgi:hypothetical protein
LRAKSDSLGNSNNGGFVLSPTVEFLIPLSPSEAMVTQLIILAASIKMHGGKIASRARIRALVHPDGDETPLRKQQKLIDTLGIEVTWVGKKEFEKYHYAAGALGRMQETFSSDVVVLIDADTLVAGPLDEFIETCYQENRFFGLTAFTPPPYTAWGWKTDENSKEIWTKLFTATGLGEPPFICEYSAWNKLFFTEIDRFCPPYFNFGVIFAPSPVVSKIGQIIFKEFDNSRNLFPQNYANTQFAISLAIQRLSINYGNLGLKCNFPITVPAFLDVSDKYMEDIRVFHYLGDWEGDLKRPRDFGDIVSVGNFIERCQDMEKLRSFIKALKPVYKRIEFSWLWNGYAILEKHPSLPETLKDDINQTLEEATNWAKAANKLNSELAQNNVKLEGECAQLRSHVNDLENNTSLLKKECDELRSQINICKGSVSWRITAPLRCVGKILGFSGVRH